MDPFLVPTAIVAAAEVGDKTQLLTLLLTARYRRPWVISLGILIATLANHAGAAGIGEGLARLINPDIQRYVVAAAFVLMGLWLLKPDEMDDDEASKSFGGVLLTTVFLFFLAEMGDKTQIATVALAARYEAFIPVVAGTTLGMLIANVPVAFGGQMIIERVPVVWIQRSAAGLFFLLGILTFFSPWA
ncbi:MAG TPA: TMEM165/GDT1 family protein [Gammaproteobacteria bacterium]|nr:TMEM165/GDT1 family protein [Gammaproteobacteria bacterium]